MDEGVWDDMRERLMRLTTKQLRQLAKDEGISLGYAASRKDAAVAEIRSAVAAPGEFGGAGRVFSAFLLCCAGGMAGGMLA